MYLSGNSKAHRTIPLVLAASLFVAACGGGSGSDASAPPIAPAIVDNVLFSVTPGMGVAATINKAGYLRAYDMSNGHPVTIALGSTPMTGNATSATGNGWLLSSDVFAQGTVSLNANSDKTTYTLKAQSANGQVSNSTMKLASNLIKPTLSSLAGNYETGPYYSMTINGSSFTGNYGYCSWSGTMRPNDNTIDVTDIKFENIAVQENITGQPCPYAGKSFHGTAYLLGPGAAYAKGAIDIIFDDGGSSTPTMINLYNFIRQ